MTIINENNLQATSTYFIADWEHWLGDWEHLGPMMQQLYSFLLFCCCDDKSIRATFKPSYVSKYMRGWPVIIWFLLTHAMAIKGLFELILLLDQVLTKSRTRLSSFGFYGRLLEMSFGHNIREDMRHHEFLNQTNLIAFNV